MKNIVNNQPTAHYLGRATEVCSFHGNDLEKSEGIIKAKNWSFQAFTMLKVLIRSKM